ncbi:unnamed protein product [Paramecium sonneborni]|uniref:WD40-repeat-containing domain n=1 Tax=Paramecium sonneborni TaxID=65129 RepID=A0A8S1KZN5_9CILI|nr:unnamed protein product [Paramecium sonneborni]
MINPQQFHILKNNNLQIDHLACNQHKQPYKCIDLSLQCDQKSRLKCFQCQQNNNNCVPIDIFSNLCQDIYKNIQHNNFSATQTILLKFQKQVEEIQSLLQALNNKLIKISSIERPSSNCLELLKGFINCKEKMKDEILIEAKNVQKEDWIFQKFGVQEFENLAEQLSQYTILKYENLQYTLKFKDIDDQQLAESNQYLELIQSLKQQILKFQQENDIKNLSHIQIEQVNQLKDQQIQECQTNTNMQREFLIEKSEKLFLQEKCSIADIQLNYDQSIICLRFIEPNNSLSFWKYNPERKQWNFWTSLQCYIQSLIDFKMSKLENSFITCGADFHSKEFKISKDFENDYSLKIWKKQGEAWFVKQVFKPVVSHGYAHSRISYVLFSKSEKQIYYSEGQRLAMLEQKGQDQDYQLKFSIQKSSEIITILEMSNNGKLLATGGFDQKVVLWRIDDVKLTQFQQLKLYNTPKRILFSQDDQDLIICTKDGVVHCFNNQDSKQKEYKENQKIFNNNNNKIRTIEFNKDSSILAIGGEANIIQLWKKDAQNQWKCYNEAKQDNFIESICFKNCPDVIYASNNNEIYIHHLK